MKKLALLVAFFAAAACAGEGPEPGAERVLVDIRAVESAADIAPVDGLRSAGQPDAADLELIRDAGYRAVIDLRGAGENRGLDDEAAAVEALGLDYVSLPIEGSSAISFDNARKLDALIEQYDGPVLIHCGSGNRVGALLALRKSLDGATDTEALAYGTDAGLTGLAPVVEERLADD